MNIPNQTRRNTLILTSIILVLAWGVIYLFLTYQLDSSINRQFRSVADSAQRLFEIDLEHSKKGLNTELTNMVSHHELSKALKDGDYEGIKSIALPFYTKLKYEYPALNILTFRSPEGITLFRAHKPEYFGDMLNEKRTLIVDTNSFHRSFNGFEVGKFEMTYRITKPIFHNNVYVGNVELGLSPEGFLRDLNSIFKAEIGIAIEKSLLDIMLDKDAFAIDEKYLLIGKSKDLKTHLKRKQEAKNELYKIDMNIELKNHLSQTLGRLVVGFDMSEIAKKDAEFVNHLFLMIVVIMLILGGVHHFGFSEMLKYFSKQVFTDHLTDLLNRHALNDALFSKHSKVLILSNIKEFSLINELYGVDVGNEVLVQVAKSFKEFGDEHGFDAYRISSDEFVLLKKEDDFKEENYFKIIEKLQSKIGSLKMQINGVDEGINIEIYCGMAFDHEHSLEDAQMALKKAKKEFLTYMLYSKKVDTKEHSGHVMKVKRSIKYALEHKNVIPFFQPITNRDKEIIKYEALVRIVEFEGGAKKILFPSDFLAISMNSGLYIKIAKEMLEQSLSFFLDRDEKVSINFLPNDFFNSSIMDALMEHIQKFDSPQRIVIEITENEGVENFQRLAKVVKKLKSMGVLIAIDDFGSGYANYAHIMEIKPDYIKIDGSLIQNILTDNDSKILVQSIVRFAKDLNITTVAEFVESEEIFELLKEYGVDEFQGYYFGRPTDLIS